MRFNLTNEPCLKYSHAFLADKGIEKTQWTSYRLFNEVLYVENEQDRYEISMLPHLSPMGYYTYRCAKVKLPLMRIDQQKHPLLDFYLQIIDSDLDWQEFIWTPDTLVINNQKIYATKFYWCPRTVDLHSSDKKDLISSASPLST
jgi:hypothetical protein